MLPTSTFFRHHPLLLCFLLFLALLYTFFYRLFAFLLASSPVLILTAFLLGVVLVYSDPDLPPEDDHVYNKISQVHCRTTTTRTRRQRFPRGSDSAASSDSDNPLAISTATSLTSFPDGGDDNDESESESEAEHLHPEEKHESEVVRVVAWTAEDDKSIENIGSLELEMNATVEKLMSRRRAGRQRHHADLDDTSKLSVHVTSRKNPFDLDVPYHEDDFPGSAPSMLHPSRNPFFFDDSNNNEDDLHLHAPPPSSSLSSAPGKTGMMFRRHESFTVGAPFASDFRPSRFRPYFVTEKMQDQPVAIPQASGKSSSSSSSSSSVGAGAANANKGGGGGGGGAAAALAEAAAAVLEVKTDEGGMVVAVDVELISDSSDDDMSLPAGDDEQEQKMQMKQQQEVAVSEDDGESFEVESIMKQVAAAAAGKGNQSVADPAYDYSPSSAGKLEKTEQAFDQAEAGAVAVAVPSIREEESSSASGGALAPPSKLASMRRVFHDQDEAEDGAWVAPSKLASVEEKETREREVSDTLAPPLPPLAAPAAAPPPLAAASLKEKAVGKSSRYKPPSKKAVLGFFRK